MIRACKTASEERAVVAKECALIRTSFKETADNGYRHRNVAKLLFIHMLGYPTHFGQMESLKLVASPRFPEKRIGYLGLMILLDEKQNVLLLVTNSLKNDFSNPNPYVVGLALCAMGNIASADIARDLSSEVEKLFRSANPYIRKKAALCAVRVVRKVPELIEDYIPATLALLNDKNHAVILSAVILLIEMIKQDSKILPELRKSTGAIVRLLKNMVLAGYVSEYDVCGITDPFLQIKIIQLLGLLGAGDSEASDEMNDILAQVAINTESSKNPGNAILYECVQTIMSIEAESGLRILAVNILGRFLLNRDNNIRYVALNTLCKAVQTDTQAVQRHRNTVVDCLKDADISIRRRALDLIYALVTKSNVRALVKELLNYLALASGDVEFKADLTEKICLVVDRFAPSKRWHIDTLIQVLAIAGSYTREAVPSNLIGLIARSKTLHPYAVHKAFQALSNIKTTELPLVHVGVWCIGEYGEYLKTQNGVERANVKGDNFTVIPESKILDMLEQFMKSPLATVVTKSYILNALIKLSSRLTESSSRLKEMIASYESSMSVELQQRSIEYSQLLQDNLNPIRGKIVMPMPPWSAKKSKNAEDAKRDFSSDEEHSEPSEDEGEEAEEAETEETEPEAKPAKEKKDKAPKSNGTSNPLDVFGGAAPAPTPAPKPANKELDLLAGIFGDTSSSTTTKPAASSMSHDPVASLLMSTGRAPPPTAAAPFPGLGFPMASPASAFDPLAMFASAPTAPVAPVPSAAAPDAQKFPPLTAFQKNGVSISFAFRKPAPDKTQILASFINSTDADISNFDFKVAVPKYITLRLKAATSTSLPPHGGKATQGIELQNSLQGQKKLQLRCKVDYVANGSPVSEQFAVDNFPDGI